MPGVGRWLVAAATFSFGMAALVACIALALGTTGHDWHAAWKLTLTDAMLGVGIDSQGPVEYRKADGETVTVARYRLAYIMDEAWLARRKMLLLAADRAVLGAWTGLALFAMWVIARAVARLLQPSSEHGTFVEPTPRVRTGYAGRTRRPDDWSDEELIATLARRSGRLGVLLVSPDEAGRLAGGGGHAAGPSAATRKPLPPPTRPAGLPSPERTEPGFAGTGSRPDNSEPDGTAGDKAAAPRRKPGEDFF